MEAVTRHVSGVLGCSEAFIKIYLKKAIIAASKYRQTSPAGLAVTSIWQRHGDCSPK